jgi:hypothetical protein
MSRIDDILSKRRLGAYSGKSEPDKCRYYEIPKKVDQSREECDSCHSPNAIFIDKLNDTVCPDCHYSEGYHNRLTDEQYGVYLSREEPMTDSEDGFVWPPLFSLGHIAPSDYNERQRDVIMNADWWKDQYGDLWFNLEQSWLSAPMAHEINVDEFSLVLKCVPQDKKVCEVDTGFYVKD